MRYWNKLWVKKFYRNLQENGIKVATFKASSTFLALCYDFYYRLDTETMMTMQDASVIGENKIHGEDYQATPFLPIRILFNKIRNIIPNECTLVDYGCGKGRILLVASEYGIQTVKGIDYAPCLCQIARNNINQYVKRARNKTTFHIIESDAIDYPIAPEDNFFFFFNPFKELVMDRILDKIERSLQDHPRFSIFAYINPEYEYLFEKRSYCKSKNNYNIYSYPMNIYFNEKCKIE